MADALHTPGGVTSAAEARLDDAGLVAIQGPTALDIRTGVMAGPGATALVSGTASTSPMQYSIAVHHWVTSRGVNTDGVYRGTTETTQLVSTTAAPGSGSRIDIIYEKQGDASSTISPDASTAVVYGVAQGTATTGTPVAPSIPVGAMELARATVAAGATATNGAGVTITQTVRQTVARGGIAPIRTSEASDAGAYVGQYRDHPTLGLQRWSGSAWVSAVAGFPVADLRQTATQTGIPSSVWTAIVMGVADLDTHGGWAASPNPTRWTVPSGQDGIYEVGGAISLASGAAAILVGARTAKNGVLINGSAAMVQAVNAGPIVIPSNRKRIQLVAGDYLEVQGYVGQVWSTRADAADLTSTLSLARIR